MAIYRPPKIHNRPHASQGVSKKDEGEIPLPEVHQHTLLRDVKLTALGVLGDPSMRCACTLDTPYHTGTGGEDDFA